VALIDPTGGKTTLLNILTGLLSPVSGRVYLAGGDHRPLDSKRIALGMVAASITSLFRAEHSEQRHACATRRAAHQLHMLRPSPPSRRSTMRRESCESSPVGRAAVSRGDLLRRKRRLELTLPWALGPRSSCSTSRAPDSPTRIRRPRRMLRLPAYNDVAILFVAHDMTWSSECRPDLGAYYAPLWPRAH